jgi:hypothetical protein
METETPVIVDPSGRPARRPETDVCPSCGAGADQRRASTGFGVPWPVCVCGYEWKDRVFRG